MYFSLICATINRVAEVDNLLRSLAGQTCRDFEIIMVDQNEDDRLESVVKKYKTILNINHIRSTRKGASYNRNIGLTAAKGKIVGFPDDDCEYRPDTLEYVKRFFDNDTDHVFFTFNSEDKIHGRRIFPCGKHDISNFNFHNSGIEYTVFIKMSESYQIKFDDNLGVGTRFSQGECADLFLNLLDKKLQGFYDGSYTIYHPEVTKNYNIARSFSYGLGYGAFYKKAVFYYKKYYLIFQFIWHVIRNIGGLVLKPQKHYYLNGLKGKLCGFLQYTIKDTKSERHE